MMVRKWRWSMGVMVKGELFEMVVEIRRVSDNVMAVVLISKDWVETD